jgi:hypothetical protein
MAGYISKQSVKLLLGRGEADTDGSGLADVIIKVPTAGRAIEGGSAWFENHEPGDWVSASLKDDDNILGYGAGFVVDSFDDTDLAAGQQGWYFMGSQPIVLNPIVTDDPSDIPGNFYLHVCGHKKNVATADTLYVNIHWGRRIR